MSDILSVTVAEGLAEKVPPVGSNALPETVKTVTKLEYDTSSGMMRIIKEFHGKDGVAVDVSAWFKPDNNFTDLFNSHMDTVRIYDRADAPNEDYFVPKDPHDKLRMELAHDFGAGMMPDMAFGFGAQPAFDVSPDFAVPDIAGAMVSYDSLV